MWGVQNSKTKLTEWTLGLCWTQMCTDFFSKSIMEGGTPFYLEPNDGFKQSPVKSPSLALSPPSSTPTPPCQGSITCRGGRCLTAARLQLNSNCFSTWWRDVLLQREHHQSKHSSLTGTDLLMVPEVKWFGGGGVRWLFWGMTQLKIAVGGGTEGCYGFCSAFFFDLDTLQLESPCGAAN